MCGSMPSEIDGIQRILIYWYTQFKDLEICKEKKYEFNIFLIKHNWNYQIFIQIGEPLSNSHSTRKCRITNGTFLEHDVAHLKDILIISLCFK